MEMRNVLSATVGCPSTRAHGFGQREVAEIERFWRTDERLFLAVHARRLAEQDLERKIDGWVSKLGVFETSCGFSVASPTTANGQRSRSQS